MQIHITSIARLFLPRTFLSTKELLSKYWLNQWRNSTRPSARQNRSFEWDDHKSIGVMKRKSWCWQHLYLKSFLTCLREAHISLCVCLLLCGGKLCPRTPEKHQEALVAAWPSVIRLVPVQTQLAVSAVAARANPGYFLPSLLQQEKLVLFLQTHCGRKWKGRKTMLKSQLALSLLEIKPRASYVPNMNWAILPANLLYCKMVIGSIPGMVSLLGLY